MLFTGTRKPESLNHSCWKWPVSGHPMCLHHCCKQWLVDNLLLQTGEMQSINSCTQCNTLAILPPQWGQRSIQALTAVLQYLIKRWWCFDIWFTYFCIAPKRQKFKYWQCLDINSITLYGDPLRRDPEDAKKMHRMHPGQLRGKNGEQQGKYNRRSENGKIR